MIRRFDMWLGKTLFVPLVIRLCQQFKISQYALHTYIWLVVWLTFVWDGPGKHPNFVAWVWYTIVCIFALLWTCIAALVPDAMGRNNRMGLFFRILWASLVFFWLLVAVPIDVIGHSSISTDVYFGGRDWFILLAEYARTIKTIPPLESKEKSRAAKLARQKA